MRANNNNNEVVDALRREMIENDMALQSLTRLVELSRAVRDVKTLPEQIRQAAQQMRVKADEIKAIANQSRISQRQLSAAANELQQRTLALNIATWQHEIDQLQSQLAETIAGVEADSTEISRLRERRLSLTYVVEGTDGAQQEHAQARKKVVQRALSLTEIAHARHKTRSASIQEQLQTLFINIKASRKKLSGDQPDGDLPELLRLRNTAAQHHAELLSVCAHCQERLDDLYQSRKVIKRNGDKFSFRLMYSEKLLGKSALPLAPEMVTDEDFAFMEAKLAEVKARRDHLLAAINAETCQSDVPLMVEVQQSSAEIDYQRAVSEFKHQLTQEPIYANAVEHDLYSAGRLLLTAVETMQTNDLNYRTELLQSACLVLTDYTNPVYHQQLAALASQNKDGNIRKQWLAGGIFMVFFGVTMMAASVAVIGLSMGGALPLMIPAMAASVGMVMGGAAMCHKSKRTGTAKALSDYQHDGKLAIKHQRKFSVFQRNDERRPLLASERELKDVMSPR